jgi:hypothetical protein
MNNSEPMPSAAQIRENSILAMIQAHKQQTGKNISRNEAIALLNKDKLKKERKARKTRKASRRNRKASKRSRRN